MLSEPNKFVQYRPNAVIRVTGEDAATFLQGQFTNELRQQPGNVTYGLWLNQKGRVIADSHVLRLAENEFLLVSRHSAAEIICKRLQEYIVADDVNLTDETPQRQGLTLVGAEAGAFFQETKGGAPAAGKFIREGAAMVFQGRLLPGENFEMLVAENEQAAIRQSLLERGWLEEDRSDMEWARIAAGLPTVPQDIGPADLPNEGGLDETAISYTKGCYLGQEVMARLKNLGQVRRRLHVLRGSGPPPPAAALLYQGEHQAGEIRSVARRSGEYLALAMISLLRFAPGAGLSLAPGGLATLRVESHG